MYTAGISIFAVYLGIGILLFSIQRSFIYFPSEAVQHSFEEAEFDNKGTQIRTVLVNSGKKHAILYFGGNAESVASSAPEFQEQFPSHSVYLVNYRGYGGSEGKPDEVGLFSDALYIYDDLLTSYDSVSIIGRSLGSGVASYVASERSVDKLVLVTPFDSLQNVAQKRFPVYPMSLLCKDKYDSLGRAQDIHSDVLILAAENDEIIALSHTKNLVKSFVNENPNFIVIDKAQHNDISLYGPYYEAITHFLKAPEDE